MSSKSNGNGKTSASVSKDFDSLYRAFARAFYGNENHDRATALAPRLEDSLASSPELAESIRGEEVRSLLAELRGNLAEAIQSREAEIRKILELHTLAVNSPAWDYVSRQYGYSDVSDRLDLLAILYDRQGNLDRAIAVLLESKQYCASHQVPFDALDLLAELEQAKSGATDQAPALPTSWDRLDSAIRRVYRQFGQGAADILVTGKLAREFARAVNQSFPADKAVSTESILRRLLTLSRRGADRGGLPRRKRRGTHSRDDSAKNTTHGR
jgi:hypothetical protein